MQQSKKKWKLYAIQHSHTDIGYTDRQEKIERYHIDFIKQAIEIVEKIQSGEKKEWAGFRWTCEAFWAVERFLKKVDTDWIKRFESALRSGKMELSGNYLNMTELIDHELLGIHTQKSVDYGKSLGLKVDSAMTADVNGYSWGYAKSLLEAGIQHLFSCVHIHHGMFPLNQKQTPFWWEAPNGEKLLVWNGDHYHLGNALGIVPNGVKKFDFFLDDFERGHIVKEHFKMAETRIPGYLKQLEEEGYPYDFVPVMISGLGTDNAPPNGQIMDFVNQWNETHGSSIEVELITLSDFFAHVKNTVKDIPVYRGDWPDWWSDGVASTAKHTQLFREAQRMLRVVKQLSDGSAVLSKEKLEEAEYNLMMYAEHTWGYSASVREPWNKMVHALDARKEAYASQGHRLVYDLLDDITEDQGELLLTAQRPMCYKIINPFSYEIKDVVTLHVERWEAVLLEREIEVVDVNSGEVHPYQLKPTSRGTQVCIVLDLKAHEQKQVMIQPVKEVQMVSTSRYRSGKVSDIRENPVSAEDASQVKVTKQSMATPYVQINWDQEQGIYSWIDKTTGDELLRGDRQHQAFTPVYEKTPVQGRENMATARNQMQRNRKGKNVIRTTGVMTDTRVIANGPLFAAVELFFEVPGTKGYSVVLTGYKDISRVDASVRVHKDSLWEPENLHISLPFTNGDPQKEQLWIEKTGAVLRPRTDQLPGTGIDFYCIQEGLVYISKRKGLAIATPDTPLIQVGPLAHEQRILQGHPQLADDPAHLYSWVLNNYWETNFKAEMGGFYEFKYSVLWGNDLNHPEKAIERCNSVNVGTICFRCR